jgi:hypothetical protein
MTRSDVTDLTLEQVRELALKRTQAFKPGNLVRQRGRYLLRVRELLDQLVAEGTLMYADSDISGRWYYPPNHPTRRRGATHDYSGLELKGRSDAIHAPIEGAGSLPTDSPESES